MDQSSVYLSKTSSPKLILIFVFAVGISLSFLAGYLFPKFNSPTVSTKPNPAVPPNPAVNLPIATDSSAVKSLYMVYLLSGVIENITPITKNNKSGYEIQILTPTGPLINQKFFASDQTTNIVSLDNKGKETKYQLSNLKKGDPIQLNYQLDIKKQSESQVTKIAVLK